MELEYKFYIDFQVDKEDILNSSYWEKFNSNNCERLELNAYYYDTKDGMLAAESFALRIRNSELTIKANSEIEGELSARPEWNIVWPSNEMDVEEVLNLLKDELNPKQVTILNEANSRGLEVQYKTEIVRYRKILNHNDAQFEVVVDLGTLYGGHLSEDCYEMEVEFISGTEEDFHNFALETKEFFDLKPGQESKMARCVKLKEQSKLEENN